MLLRGLLGSACARRSAEGRSGRGDGGGRRTKRCPLPGFDRRAVGGVEQGLALEQGAGDPEQPVGDAAQGTTIGVPTRPGCLVAAAAFGVMLHSDPRPVEHGLAQAGLGGTAHDDDAGLAAALGPRRRARQRSEGRVVPARERAAGLGEQGGEGAPADAGQRGQYGGIAGVTLMAGWRRMPSAVAASILRMRCCLSRRAIVASRRRAALAGVGAMVRSASTHSAAPSSASSSSCGS